MKKQRIFFVHRGLSDCASANAARPSFFFNINRLTRLKYFVVFCSRCLLTVSAALKPVASLFALGSTPQTGSAAAIASDPSLDFLHSSLATSSEQVLQESH
jgi:hypothetical protein